MKKISRRKGDFLGKKIGASNFGGVLFVSLILIISVILVATPSLSDPLSPKYIYGCASRCDGGSVAGASVVATASGLPAEYASVGIMTWSLDISGDGSQTEWPDGTVFSGTITMGGWSDTFSGTVSGHYTNVGNVSLTPTTSLSATATASSLTVLVGDPVSFTGSASGGATPYTWSWDFNGEGSSAQQNPSFSFSTQGSKNCVLTVTDACSSIDTDSVTVQVNPALSGSGGGPYSGDVCNPVSFSGSATGGCTPYTYSWAFSDGDSASGQNPTHQFTSDGSYTATLTITDSDSPPNTYICTPASVTISTATLVADAGGPYSGIINSAVQFYGSATGGTQPYSWSWDFGDGNMGHEQNPTHQYTSNGTYNVTLNVTDDDGVYDSISQMIIIRDNTPPVISTMCPLNNSINISRPLTEFNVTVSVIYGDNMSIYIRWINHTSIEDKWDNLTEWIDVFNGTYTFTPPNSNDWIWGNTTYTWSVNVTDGITWTNKTFTYATGGSRYDVNNNDIVNFQDAGLVWIHRTSELGYDGIYDVNQNGVVNFQDAGLTWVNRD